MTEQVVNELSSDTILLQLTLEEYTCKILALIITTTLLKQTNTLLTISQPDTQATNGKYFPLVGCILDQHFYYYCYYYYYCNYYYYYSTLLMVLMIYQWFVYDQATSRGLR